ncbi:MAG: molecular chaperone [Hyphomicrobiaceae bacterium]
MVVISSEKFGRMEAPQIDVPLSQEDVARALVYRLLARFLSAPVGQEELQLAASMEGGAGPLGESLSAFAGLAATSRPDGLADQYQVLFIGLGRGELVPYASYYLTGFLQEKPLARLRGDMSALGVERTESTSEPEDHVSSVLETMAALIDGSLGPQLNVEAQKIFFTTHVASWMAHFFKDLEESDTSELYASVGRVGARFLEVEEEAFRMVV